MNLKDLHNQTKAVSALSLFKGEMGTATAIQLKENSVLKEHITKTPALLLCITGHVIYEDETAKRIELRTGDYVNIVPNVKHWLVAQTMSQLVLLK
ncbi:MAG: cupin domain-containing protein [Lewinella sp.]|uniref:cupin domain-containing protein n=1 Tax=Lewinella sp. TaxID=2004506 RepID=UPI003D6AAAD1